MYQLKELIGLNQSSPIFTPCVYKYYKLIYPYFTYYYKAAYSQKHDLCKLINRILVMESCIEQCSMEEYLSKKDLDYYTEISVDEWNNQLLKIL